MPIPTFRSCVPQEPSIAYGSGTGIVIDPYLPQSNSFSAYSQIPVNVDSNVFTDVAKAAPANSFFTKMALAANQTDAFVVAFLQENYPKVITLKTIERITIGSVPNPLYDSALAMADQDYNVPATIDGEIKVTETKKMFADMLFEEVVAKVKNDKVLPVISYNLSNHAVVTFVTAPATEPRLFVVEEYRIAAYLGKYGLGRVVRTFSLLPGEKTTITVKTYKDTVSTKTASENVLDSFTQTSANELEKLVQAEKTTNSTDSKTKSLNANLSLSLNPMSFMSGGSAGGGINNTATASRTANTNNLNKALEKHVNTSNANRQMTINTSTSETTKEGEETSTVREISNINKSRVLNFIFRQLHQQYISVTYLANLKIAFCNGYEESLRIVGLEELDGFLATLVVESQRPAVERLLLRNYCTVQNHKDIALPFLERYALLRGGCLPAVVNTSGVGGLLGKLGVPAPLEPADTVSYWRKKPAVQDSVLNADSKYGFDIKVAGVILSVQENTLKTSSVLVESLLGQADALDCFSMKIQDAEAQKGYQDLAEREQHLAQTAAKNLLDNDKQKADTELLRLQMEIIRKTPDPKVQADLYKRIFGTCCDTPQTVIQK